MLTTNTTTELDKPPETLIDLLARTIQEDVSVLDRNLPKWPQMIVVGDPVTPEQAEEIIRRTDGFFQSPGGNDINYRKRVMKALKMPLDYAELDEFNCQWGTLYTEYVHNDWIASNFAYGAHGWCHPSGKIQYLDNVGKWPNASDVMEDWRLIAGTFPFLRLVVILMSGESCEHGVTAVCGFFIQDGKVICFDPKIVDDNPNLMLTAGSWLDKDTVIDADEDERFSNRSEQGIPWEWIERWSKRK